MSNEAMSNGANGPAGAARILQAASLLVLLVVVAVRPLVSESYDSAGSAITRAVEELADPSPARTLGFDLAILGASFLGSLAFAMDRRAHYRLTGLEWGLSLLAIGGVVSCIFAGNKRLAISATVDWICLPVLAITLTQLLRTTWQRRLALAVIIASAAVNAAQCYEQYFVGFQETIAQYESNKIEFWQKQGVELDSTTVEAFERRLRAREAGGFFAHSNVAGAYLALCAFAALSLFSAHGVGFLISLLAVALIATAVFLTGSQGALVGGMIGLALLALYFWKGDWLHRHRRRLFWLGWIAVILAAAAIIGHGLYHDSLPGWSLTFRWQYWKATASMIADHFLTGVGRENFGRHYTFYKDIASPEEVTNPHNFLLQTLAEMGLFGFLGLLLMLFGVTYRMATKPEKSAQPESITIEKSGVFAWAAVVGLGVIVLRSFLLGTTNSHFVYYTAVTTALVWFPVCLLFAWPRTPSLRTPFLAAGLLAFLVQDAISFALFVPASATTFFAVVGIWLSTNASTTDPEPTPKTAPRWLMPLASAIAIVLFALFALAPVARARHWLKEADRQSRSGNFAEADRAFARAQQLDPTPCIENARAFAERKSVPSLQSALPLLQEAARRDPHLISICRNESFIHSALAAMTNERKHYDAAIESAKAALALYPQDPHGLVRLADTHATAGRALQSRDHLIAAISHYRQALALDEKRLEWETIQRFRPRVVAEIEAKIRAIEQPPESPRD